MCIKMRHQTASGVASIFFEGRFSRLFFPHFFSRTKLKTVFRILDVVSAVWSCASRRGVSPKLLRSSRGEAEVGGVYHRPGYSETSILARRRWRSEHELEDTFFWSGRQMRLLLLVLAAPLLIARVCSLSLTSQTLVGTDSITSLVFEDNHLYCGTKRGKVQKYQWTKTSLEWEGVWEDETAKPFPIYSMAIQSSTDGNIQLFCGGGDRYVSVWQSHSNKGAERTQLLGPHTGWVKAVLYQPEKNLLHSIGCNCIESWHTCTDTSSSSWSHLKKLSIESSPDQGATLSSDLLCLSASGNSDYFFAGGVDGRIHLWSSNVKQADPFLSIGAHKGRINVLLYMPTSQLLLSAGHDGAVQCRTLADDAPTLTDPDAIFCLPFQDADLRWTAAACVKDTKDEAIVVLGSASGLLVGICASTRRKPGRAFHMEQWSNIVTLPDDATVHAISALHVPQTESNDNDCFIVAVGHSLGLSVVELVANDNGSLSD